MTRRLAGLELGGTKCIAVLAQDETIVARERVETREPKETLAALRSVLERWHGQEALAALGVAAFGPLVVDPAHPQYGRIGRSPKLAWRGADVLAPFEALGIPAALDTDVAGAALAEGLWGAARDARVHIYLTIGTGVGGGLIVDGEAVHGFLHPEMGHVRVRRAADDDFPGICPFHGDCLEGLVSGPAIAKRTGRPADTIDPSDPVWDRVAGEIGEWIASTLLTVAAERIVLGGGLGFGQPHLLPKARAAARASLNGYMDGEDPIDLDRIVVPAALGADAGPMGAIALALKAAQAR